MATKAKRHTHKYQKVEIAGSKVWACALADCSHYMPKHMENMVVGKNTYCWQCGIVMELNASNMHMDRPQCYDCQTGISTSNNEDKITIPAEFDISKLTGIK